MKSRGILLSRLLETLLLFGIVVVVETSGKGLSSSVLVLNLDFDFGLTRAGTATLLSTRLFGYLMSLVGTVSQTEVRVDSLAYLSLVLAGAGIVSHLSDTLRALGLVTVSVEFGCAALILVVDWALYARLVTRRRRSA